MLLLLLCAGFYWKLLFTGQYSFLESPDLAYLDLPRFQFQASEWHHSRFPLWNPNHWYGQPFLAQVLGAAYPPNWLLFLLPFREGKIRIEFVHWYFVLIHYFGALSCYWLCRDRKLSQPAALLAGLVFGLGGFLGNTDWPQVLNGAIWAPLVFLFLLRAVEGRQTRTSAVLSGTFLGVSWLSGHHEAPMYLSVAVAAAALFFTLRNRKLLPLCALAALFAVLTSGLQTLPAYEYGKLAVRWAGVAQPLAWNQPVPYSVHQHFSLTPASLLSIVSPGLSQNVNPFIGLAALSLALLGVYTAWRTRSDARLFTGIALGGLLLAIGGSNVFHGMLYALLPVFGKARVPARAIVLFNFGIAPLVAFGVDALRSEPGASWVRRSALWLGCLGGALIGFLFLTARASRFEPNEHLMLTGLAALALAALFAAWRRSAIGARLLLVALVALVMIEIGNVSGANYPNLAVPGFASDLARLSQHNDIAAFLKWQKEPVRAVVDDREIPYNFGDWHGIQTTGGYLASVTANVHEFESYLPRTQDLLGANFSVGRNPSRPDQVKVFAGESGINVYQNPGAFPRVWAVHEAVQVPSYGHLRVAIQNPNWDLRAKAPMLAAPPANLEACGGDDVRIVEYKAARVAIEARMNCRGLAVLSDTAFPGWKATVDGAPVAILEPYGALRGVIVERGLHRIEMHYEPRSALLGALMTAAGLLGACGLLLRQTCFRRS